MTSSLLHNNNVIMCNNNDVIMCNNDDVIMCNNDDALHYIKVLVVYVCVCVCVCVCARITVVGCSRCGTRAILVLTIPCTATISAWSQVMQSGSSYFNHMLLLSCPIPWVKCKGRNQESDQYLGYIKARQVLINSVLFFTLVPILSPSSSKYVQQWDPTWAMPRESERTSTETQDKTTATFHRLHIATLLKLVHNVLIYIILT